jgi:hypothetical protein
VGVTLLCSCRPRLASPLFSPRLSSSSALFFSSSTATLPRSSAQRWDWEKPKPLMESRVQIRERVKIRPIYDRFKSGFRGFSSIFEGETD